MVKVKKKKKKYFEAITVCLYYVAIREPATEIATWIIVFEKVIVMEQGQAGCFSVNTDQVSPTIRGCRSWDPAITTLLLCLLSQK